MAVFSMNGMTKENSLCGYRIINLPAEGKKVFIYSLLTHESRFYLCESILFQGLFTWRSGRELEQLFDLVEVEGAGVCGHAAMGADLVVK